MTADNPSPLVPKLRFPEFRDSGEWETRKLGDVISRSKQTFDPQKSRDTPHLIELENIESKTGRILGVAELEKHNSLKSRFQAGDVLFGKLRPYLQKFARPDFQGVCTSEIWVLRSKEISSAFLFYLVQTERFIQLANISSGSRMPRAEWNFLAVADFKIPHPDEQRKIADCLGSLDDLIAAEGRKLEALQQHKQGLMQQFFPQEGETVPQLRFPEFRDDLTWSAPQIADLYDFKRTNTLSRDKLNYETGTIRNIHYGDIHTKFKPLFRVGEEYVPYVNPDASTNEFDDDAFCEEGDIVLADASEDLDDVGKAIEVVSLDGEQVVAGTHTILGSRRGNIPVVGFGGQLFQSAAVRTGIKKEAQGAKVYGVSAKRISTVPVPIPPTVAEQQKIAECLSALDTLIGAHLAKLDGLRTHKQGLLQQLIPSLEGNEK